MNVNVAYWWDWFRWAQGAILALAKKGDFLGCATFLSEFGTTVSLVFEPFDSLAKCFKGKFYQIAANLAAWAMAHHDPLGQFRHAAGAMKEKWGKIVLENPLSAFLGPITGGTVPVPLKTDISGAIPTPNFETISHG